MYVASTIKKNGIYLAAWKSDKDILQLFETWLAPYGFHAGHPIDTENVNKYHQKHRKHDKPSINQHPIGAGWMGELRSGFQLLRPNTHPMVLAKGPESSFMCKTKKWMKGNKNNSTCFSNCRALLLHSPDTPHTNCSSPRGPRHSLSISIKFQAIENTRAI